MAFALHLADNQHWRFSGGGASSDLADPICIGSVSSLRRPSGGEDHDVSGKKGG
jgi:hypothetical protein